MIIYSFAIDTQLKSIEKLQQDKGVLQIEESAILLYK